MKRILLSLSVLLILLSIFSEGLLQSVGELMAFVCVVLLVLRYQQPAKRKHRDHYPE